MILDRSDGIWIHPNGGPSWRRILIIAFLLKIIVAWNLASWLHPDEWYQTIEFTQLRLFGVGHFTQEMALHTRSGLWPMLLGLPMGLARVFEPYSPATMLRSIQIFVALLSIGAIWGVLTVVRRELRSTVIQWPLIALLLLPGDMLRESVRASLDNALTIAAWIGFGLLARGNLFAGGLVLALLPGLKPPGGLITLGATLAVGALALRDRVQIPSLFRRYLPGLLAGSVIWGLADVWLYSRNGEGGRYMGVPFEGFINYFNYNVSSGLAAEVFGRQGLGVYWDFFRPRWFGMMAPIGVLVSICGTLGVFSGLRSFGPWAWGAAFFLVGHVFVGHKEGRFLLPLELVWVAAAVLQLGDARSVCRRMILAAVRRISGAARPIPIQQSHPISAQNRVMRMTAFGALAVGGLLMAPALLRALRGDLGSIHGSYLKIQSALSLEPRTCAVVTDARPARFLLPMFEDQYPLAPVGKVFDQRIAWFFRGPSCTSDQVVLWHRRVRELQGLRAVQGVHAVQGFEGFEGFEGLEGCRELAELRAPFKSVSDWWACPYRMVEEKFRDSTVERPFLTKSFPVPPQAGIPRSVAELQELMEATRANLDIQCNKLCAGAY